MSHTRAVALSFSIAGLVLGIAQYSSATSDPPAPAVPGAVAFTLVEADWCRDVCNQECDGDCENAYSSGCTCYWLCEGGESGESFCGEAAVPVTICTN